MMGEREVMLQEQKISLFSLYDYAFDTIELDAFHSRERLYA